MKARVLLVGTADQQLEELNADLMQAGFLTETAADARECLEVGFWFQPHLVVTEVELSEFSGLELSLFIGSGQAGFSAKVIFYTHAYRDENSRQATSSKYGASGYFVKQFHKQALLKTAIDILTSIDLEGKAQVVLPPFRLPGRNRSDPPSWTPERLDAAISGNHALVEKFQELMPHERLQEGSQEGQASDTGSRVVEMAAPVEEASPANPSQPEAQPQVISTPTEPPLEVSSETEVRSESPARGGSYEVSIPRIRDELQVAVLSKRSLSRGAKILFTAAAAILGIGLSISLWLSRTLFNEAARQDSVSPPRAQTPSLNQGGSTFPAVPAASDRPAEPSDADPATEALIRLLSDSKTPESTGKQARAGAPQSEP